METLTEIEANQDTIAETIMNEEVIYCNREHLLAPRAIGYIPLPAFKENTERRINVCQSHYDEAIELCYYVLKLHQNSNETCRQFEINTWKKHIQLRGSRKLKYVPKNGTKP